MPHSPAMWAGSCSGSQVGRHWRQAVRWLSIQLTVVCHVRADMCTDVAAITVRRRTGGYPAGHEPRERLFSTTKGTTTRHGFDSLNDISSTVWSPLIRSQRGLKSCCFLPPGRTRSCTGSALGVDLFFLLHTSYSFLFPFLQKYTEERKGISPPGYPSRQKNLRLEAIQEPPRNG